MVEKRSNLVWWILGGSLIFGLPFLVYLYIGGLVTGEEFSPDDFSRRHFSYNIVPFFNICRSGVEYHDKTPVFDQTLLNDGLLGEIGEGKGKTDTDMATLDQDAKNVTVAAIQKRWHLIRDSASDAESRDFDANLLIRFLDLVDSEHESIWIKFNEDHPELANEFWPIVADMARYYMYVELTDIMARAVTIDAESVDEFRIFMKSHASNALNSLATKKKDAGDLESARVLYKKSRFLVPKNAEDEGVLDRNPS